MTRSRDLADRGYQALTPESTGIVSVKDFGAVGDGVTDDTAAIQAAMDAAEGKTLLFENATYLVSVVTGQVYSLQPSQGTTLKGYNSTIKLAPNGLDSYKIIDLYQTDNVTIDNINITGERNEHTGSTGEFGMGIDCRGSNNLIVKNLTIRDCWGDGIYLGAGSGNSSNSNIYLENVVVDNCRRNNISVITVRGFTTLNLSLLNANGTSPEAGIDFEPNSATDEITGVHMVATKSQGNGTAGLLLVLHNLVDRYVDVKIDGWISQGDQYSYSALYPPQGNSAGTVSLTNVSSYRCITNAGVISNWKRNGVQLRVINQTAVDCCLDSSVADNLKGIISTRITDGSSEFGGVSISGLKVEKTGIVTTYDNSDISLSNADLMSDVDISGTTRANRIRFLPLLNRLNNQININNDTPYFERSYWPGTSPSEKLASVVQQEHYATDVDTKSSTLVLPLLIPTESATITFTDLVKAATIYNFNIKTEDGSLIYPQGLSEVSILGADRNYGQAFEATRRDGDWILRTLL